MILKVLQHYANSQKTLSAGQCSDFPEAEAKQLLDTNQAVVPTDVERWRFLGKSNEWIEKELNREAVENKERLKAKAQAVKDAKAKSWAVDKSGVRYEIK